MEECRENGDLIQIYDFEQEENMQLGNCGNEMPQGIRCENDVQNVSSSDHRKRGKFFYYDTPLSEETRIWIPLSVLPMSECEHEEWSRGSCENGDISRIRTWLGVDKELTMWNMVTEMLFAARGKVSAIASGGVHGCKISWPS